MKFLIRTSRGNTLLASRFLAVFVLLFSSITASADQPNIIFIYVDDLGYGDLGSFGHPIIQTPHLDKLADQGMRLTNYYAPSALCSPSRVGVLTGRTPYRTGIKSWIPENTDIYLHADEVTLAEVLKSAGYATALIGKWHLNSDLGSDTEPQPTDQGFDYFYGHNAYQIPTNRNPVNIYRNRELLPEQKGYTAQLYADEAIGWMEKRQGNQPMFLFLSMAEPHTTIDNPPEYDAMYSQFTDGEIVPIPSGLDEIPKDKLVPRGPGEYYANITFMDAQVGRVLQWLDDNDLAEETVVVFASDNGPVTENWIQWHEVNAHGSTGGLRGRKHFLYEGGIKVPAIIRHPGFIEAGSASEELMIGTDWFTTLAQMGGGVIPDDRPIDGVDAADAFNGDALPERTILWALDSRSDLEYAIREGSWKLFLDREGNPRELYDLSEDPLELFNLLSDEPDKVAGLSKQFKEMRADIGADRVGLER